MITCYIEYTIDPNKIDEFEKYAKMWIPLVNKYGGKHHGYFIPYESANNKAYALFSFTSLSEYERYRIDSVDDEECILAYQFAYINKCIHSYVRSFLKPILK